MLLLISVPKSTYHSGERQFLKVLRNHTMLATPQNVRLILWSNLNLSKTWSVQTSQHHDRTHLLTPWSELNFNCLPLRQTTQLSSYMAQSQLPTDSFSKIFKFSRPQLPGVITPTLQLHFLSGVYYDNCDYHILCPQV